MTAAIHSIKTPANFVGLTLFLCLLGCNPLLGHETTVNRHPVSIVEADIYVNRGKTTMRLKCFAEDLELLQGVEALEDGLYDSDELIDATKDHAEYLAEKIVLRDAEGEILEPHLIETIDISIPDEGIKAGMLMNYSMSFVYEIRYKKPPEFITIEQLMIADGALLPSELKILMKQAGSDSPYMHMMKPEQPETFRFDWEKPILSQDASEQEWEDWFEEQREKNLGITSYSSVYSFIYITNHEVRHEVLVPLATLASFMEFDRKDESFLDIAEQQEAAKKIERFFSTGNPMRIDSVEVKPVFDRIDFYGLDIRDFAVQAEKRRVSMASGRVGIIMSYSTKGAPTSIEVEWDKFNDVMKTVDSVVFAYDDIQKTTFSMFLENNTYKWDEPNREPLPPITDISSTIDLESYAAPKLTLPLITLGLIGLAIFALALGVMAGISWRLTGVFAATCGVASIFTTGLLPKEIPHPFAQRPQFSLEDEQARQVFAQLHKNMFRAFDYRHESDVYDALAKSVDGELLRELYLDVNESLIVKEQGGAVAQVNEVNLLDGSSSNINFTSDEDTPGFGYRCKWNLIGTIEHWGHIHERTNEYDAEFQVKVRDNGWKITSMKVLDEEQGVVKQSLRKIVAPSVTVNTLVTQDTTPELSGTVKNQTAKIVVQIGAQGPYTATNNGDGTWTLPDNAIAPALSEGIYDVSVAVTDSTQNVATDSSKGELTVTPDQPQQ